MLLALPPSTLKPVAGCEKLLQRIDSSSTFATKSLHVARFTRPRQTCFAASDVTSLVRRDYSVILTNQKSVFA